MTFDPLNPPRALTGPYPAVAPFTVRENPTQQYQIERIIAWIRDTVVPFINDNVQELGDEWATTVTELIENWETLSASLIVQVQTIADDIGGAVSDAQSAQLAAENARDAAEIYASQAEDIQDVAVTTIFSDLESDLRAALDATFATVTDVGALTGRVSDAESVIDSLPNDYASKSVQNIVETGRLSPTALAGQFVASNDIGGIDVIGASGRNTLTITVKPPATFFTDFTEFAVNEAIPWETIGSTSRAWNIRNNSSASGGVDLVTAGTGGSALLNPLFSQMMDGIVDCEIAFRHTQGSVNGGIRGGFMVDGFAENNPRNYVSAAHLNGTTIAIRNGIEGSDSTVGTTAPFTFEVDTYYTTVFRKRGIWYYAKIWKDGEPEPAEWMLTGGSPAHIDGDYGIISVGGNTQRVDWIGFAAGTDEAPRG